MSEKMEPNTELAIECGRIVAESVFEVHRHKDWDEISVTEAALATMVADGVDLAIRVFIARQLADPNFIGGNA